jgi:hypothetical protein
MGLVVVSKVADVQATAVVHPQAEISLLPHWQTQTRTKPSIQWMLGVQLGHVNLCLGGLLRKRCCDLEPFDVGHHAFSLRAFAMRSTKAGFFRSRSEPVFLRLSRSRFNLVDRR